MPTTQPAPTDIEMSLMWIEDGLTVLGVLIMAVGLWRWLRRRGVHRDPLVGSPIRRSKLTPVHVFAIILGAVAAISIAGALGDAILPAGWPEDARRNVLSLIGAATMNLALAALCLIVAAQVFPAGLREYGLGRMSWGRDLRAAVLLWIVAASLTRLLLLATDTVIRFFWPEFDAPEHSVFQTLSFPELGSWVMVLANLSALLIAPVGEELFFRGIVQSGAMKLAVPRRGSLYHRHIAVGFSAVLFGLMHLSMPHHVLPLIVLGLILGYAYERTGSLRLPILIHILFNGKSLLWYGLTSGGQ